MSESDIATRHDTNVTPVTDNNPTKLAPPSNSSTSNSSLAPGDIAKLPSGETMPSYSAPFFSPPWLDIIWPSVPDVLPIPPGNVGSGGGGAPLVANIVVPFTSVRTAEQSILSQLSTLVSQYDALANATMDAINTPGFFGQQAQAVVYWDLGLQPSNYIQQKAYVPNEPAGTPATSGTYIVPDARIQYAAEQFAYGTNGTNGMVNSMEIALTSIAGSVETAGQILAAVAKAMDAYAYADVNSAAPPLATLQAQQQQG